MNIDYISDSGEEATAVVYVNGEEYSRSEIELSAVADWRDKTMTGKIMKGDRGILLRLC